MGKRSGKRPVLTSPRKIGMLVALLCLVVGFGASYYFVSVYGIELNWLTIGEGRFNVAIDSFMFFRETYPLVAGVVVLSLISYFVIAGAVRRYKFYLASGQDYRKMISLAESIDDLTNPAQIARLSEFPELQSVLRNYGDQIREISQELDQKGKETRSVDLEMEIESLLNGDSIQETILEGKWWAPLFNKIKESVNESRRTIEELQACSESHRRLFGQAVLTLGKSMETVGQSSEDLIEIINAVGELNSIARQVGARGGEAGGGQMSDAILMEMENSIQKLQEGGHVLHEFSEENNGLALNMALTAAKGGVCDQDLAQFAEKVRGTAERFNKLNGTVASIAQGLLGSCYKLREQTTGAPSGEGDSGLESTILELSRRIEEHIKMLQERFCNLGNDTQELHGAFHESKDKFTVPGNTLREAATDGVSTDEGSGGGFVNFGADGRPDTGDEAKLVLDRSTMWGDDNDFAGETGSVELGPAAASTDFPPEIDAVKGQDLNLAQARRDEQEAIDDAIEPGGAERAGSKAAGDSREADPGSWMEMPGHRWVKIDVEQGAHQEDHEDAAVNVLSETAREIAIEAGKDGPADGADQAAGADESIPEMAEEAGIEPVAEQENKPVEAEPALDGTDGEDPIYDLFELGAVEYVEETQS